MSALGRRWDAILMDAVPSEFEGSILTRLSPEKAERG